ncbi:MAG TPA: hypothetical protein VM286_07145 [Candidatus Thermoplasmatota archaeon]|nr:hypothetical protein [Candidatus Thermoplasmatota archaeon]
MAETIRRLACPRCKTIASAATANRFVCSHCGYGAPEIPIETRIVTVPSAFVNDELSVRQTFGWQLIQSSARSFSANGTIVGLGTDGSGLNLGAGRLYLNNEHHTDLILRRKLTPRNQQLRSIEAEYDSVLFLPPASSWPGFALGAVAWIAGLVATAVILVDSGQGSDSVNPLIFAFPFAPAIALGIILNRIRSKGRARHNLEAEARQQVLLHQAAGALN